jgi:hypothetical protein
MSEPSSEAREFATSLDKSIVESARRNRSYSIFTVVWSLLCIAIAATFVIASLRFESASRDIEKLKGALVVYRSSMFG